MTLYAFAFQFHVLNTHWRFISGRFGWKDFGVWQTIELRRALRNLCVLNSGINDRMIDFIAVRVKVVEVTKRLMIAIEDQ